MKRIGIFAVVILITFSKQSFAQQDSVRNNVMSLKQFYELIYLNHPLVQRIRLNVDNAKAMQLTAKGNFDPKLFYQFNDKYFNEKNYYQLNNAGLSIPTKYGVDFKTGFENNDGYFLNPENTTPQKGLYYAQISVPLVQGIMTDERRTVLKQAQINIKATQAELDFQLNELFYKAGKSYLEWQLAFTNLSVNKEAYTLGKQRFEAVKRSFELGDRPAIDTVEAGIQVFDRLAGWQQAELEFKNKSIELTGFLWLSNNTPALLDSSIIPDLKISSLIDKTTDDSTELNEIIALHPNIRSANFKLDILNAEKKLKMEKLKPMINLNYNPLFDAANVSSSAFNNYKWGVSVNFPLFLRKERGDLMSAKLKIQQSQLELDYKKNEIGNKIKMSQNDIQYSNNQLNFFKNNIKNYEALWVAEKRLFDNGESSLFMINSRENTFINARIKLNDYNFKYNKSVLELYYAKGQLQNL
jgi:outer membrane protein TolC